MNEPAENQRIRNWMKTSTRSIFDDAKFAYRNTDLKDIYALATLMDKAYQGTIDHEGETFDQCAEEMKSTLTGKYGTFLQNSSFVIAVNNEIVCASLITLYKESPLLAFSMTAPNFQGKGMAGFLIEKSINALANTGYADLYLVVTEGNVPAQNLYSRLGFSQLGQALPQQPPPN